MDIVDSLTKLLPVLGAFLVAGASAYAGIMHVRNRRALPRPAHPTEEPQPASRPFDGESTLPAASRPSREIPITVTRSDIESLERRVAQLESKLVACTREQRRLERDLHEVEKEAIERQGQMNARLADIVVAMTGGGRR